MDGQSQKLGDEAVVVGGSGANARQCLSAASYNVKFESLPEVRELAELITNRPVQPEKPNVDSNSPIRVSKRSDAQYNAEKPHSARKVIAVAVAVIFAAVAAFGIYEAYRMMSIVAISILTISMRWSVNPTPILLYRTPMKPKTYCCAAAILMKTVFPAPTA